MKERWRQAGLTALFAGLAALEIAHGVSRLDAIRAARVQEWLDAAAAAHREAALELRTALDEERRHAAFLARTPAVRALADAGERDVDGAREVATANLLAYLAAFPTVDAVRVLDPAGLELARVQRIGGGVGALPKAMLSRTPDPAAADFVAQAPPGGAALAGFFHDPTRVEAPESERQSARYLARIPASRGGALELAVYVSPTLAKVRRFAPAPGAASYLVDADGRFLAASDRALEIGGARPGRLADTAPEVARAATAAPADGATEAPTPDGRAFVARVAETPRVALVTVVPDAPLRAAVTASLEGASTRIVLVTVLVTAALLGALIVTLRLAARAALQRRTAFELAESERRRALERRLEAADRLGAVGLLTAGLAHEINNPLEGIGNYLALLERAGADEEKRRRYVEAIRHGFARIRDLVRDLLAFARPGVVEGTCDGAAAAGHAASMARFSADGKDVDYVVDPSAHAEVACHPGRLEQVFLNLLLNAAKAIRSAGRAGGRVTVSAVRETAPDGAPRVAFLVDDDGPGIAPENLPKLFDPFFTTGGGSGLGLAVTYGIVRAHGGEIVAENRPEGGARFVVRLPAAARAAVPVGAHRS
ncbi:MAG TPA: ATP-binding protein [Planctomycetota bacterium]|nr:ATP-binding protein [Planctomycetota bacterium]